MNLTAIFKKDAAIVDAETAKKAAIVDHTWMQDGIVHPGQPQLDLTHVRKHNNIKPELEIQWGLGGPDVDVNEPAGKVTRTLPEEAEGDAGKIILFARDLMNKGTPSYKVIAALKKRYGSVPKKAEKGLTDLFRMDGVIGRFAVDARGYSSCKEALKAASQSPYKRFIKHVVGCECGSPHLVASRLSGSLVLAKSSGNPMDDFLASEKDAVTPMVAHCRSTMLPIMAGEGDLDKSDLDSTLVEMMNVTGIPGSVVSKISAKKMSNTAKLASAFRWLDKKAYNDELAQYSQPIPESDVEMVPEMTDFELSGLAIPDIDVDTVDSSIQQEFTPDALIPSIDVDGRASDLDVVPEDVISVSDIPIDERPLALEIEPIMPDSMDVDMGQALDSDFAGSDEVLLDEPTTLMDEVAVDILPNPNDEMGYLASDKKAMDFPTQDALDKYLKDHPDAG